MTQLNKSQISLLGELAKEMNIYIVLDKFGQIEYEIFTALEFREAVQGVNYHSLKGFKKITHIVSDNSSYVHSNNSLGIIITGIDKLLPETREKKFDSNGFYWIKM